MSRMLDIKSKDLEKVLYFASYIITEVDYEAREADADDLREELAADLEEIDAECARQIESLKEQGDPENFDEFSDEEPLTPEAVSYTHLDVYKRQVVSRSFDRSWRARTGPEPHRGIHAVGRLQLRGRYRRV